MSKILYPKEDVENAIKSCICILRELKINYIAFPPSFIKEDSEYLNWKQATRITWLEKITNILVEELKLILTLENSEIFSKEEKLSLQTKSLRRVHELLGRIILMSEVNDDEGYLTIVLENLYTLGRGYKYAPSSTQKQFEKQYLEEIEMSKILFKKLGIPTYDIADSNKYKKFGNIQIQEKVFVEKRYEALNKPDGLPISKIKVYNQKDMYYKYMMLSEYTHAKPYYSYIFRGLSERLPLLFTHELCLLALEFLSILFLNKKKEIELWVSKFPEISKSYSQYSRIANSLVK